MLIRTAANRDASFCGWARRGDSFEKLVRAGSLDPSTDRLRSGLRESERIGEETSEERAEILAAREKREANLIHNKIVSLARIVECVFFAAVLISISAVRREFISIVVNLDVDFCVIGVFTAKWVRNTLIIYNHRLFRLDIDAY